MLTPANGPEHAILDLRQEATQCNWLKCLLWLLRNWVRLVRSGTTYTGYRSADGVSWTQVGSISLTMASSATAGLVVTAHNNSLLNTSTFDKHRHHHASSRFLR